MDPSQYLKNYPQPLHLHPNSSFRLHNNSHDNNSFRHNSPRSRDRPYFNRRRGHSLQLSQKRNSESQYSSDSFNDSSSSSSMNSPHFRNYSQVSDLYWEPHFSKYFPGPQRFFKQKQIIAALIFTKLSLYYFEKLIGTSFYH